MLAGKWLKIHVGVSSLKISTTLILLHAIFLWGFKSAPFKNVYLLHDFAIRIKENDKFEEYSIIKHYKTTTMSCNKNQIAYPSKTVPNNRNFKNRYLPPFSL